MTIESILDRIIATTLPISSIPSNLYLFKSDHGSAGFLAADDLSREEDEAMEMLMDAYTVGVRNSELFLEFASLIRYSYACEHCDTCQRELDDYKVIRVLILSAIRLHREKGVFLTGKTEADICMKCNQSRIFNEEISFIRVPKILCIALEKQSSIS